MTMADTYAVILAAGKGTRMKSKLYKVLHPVCGKPMVQHVLDAVTGIDCREIFVVVGHGAETVEQRLGPTYTFVKQEEQLGTGHAVMVAKNKLVGKSGQTLILCGDTPLVTKETLQALVDAHEQNRSAVTLLTTEVDDPTGYGRIIRDDNNQVLRIVEQKDATDEEQLVKEINTGIYCFDNQSLLQALDELKNDNAQGEYYLTDCIEVLVDQGQKITAYTSADAEETMGVNDRLALAEAEKAMRRRINEAHMRQGVTLIDPEHTYIESDVRIGQDTLIHPGTILRSGTEIGEDCVLGPNTEIVQSKIGDRCTIEQAKVIDSTVGQETKVGPYAYIRPGSAIGEACKIGDFVEVKNAVIKDRTKIPHLSYVGDADIGSGVNMGCGSITVNYDGENKHRTVVEDGSFIGCNVNLVAPVTVGEGSYVAAGSTITDSVPAESLAIARQRQTNKEQYVHKMKHKQKSSRQ